MLNYVLFQIRLASIAVVSSPKPGYKRRTTINLNVHRSSNNEATIKHSPTLIYGQLRYGACPLMVMKRVSWRWVTAFTEVHTACFNGKSPPPPPPPLFHGAEREWHKGRTVRCFWLLLFWCFIHFQRQAFKVLPQILFSADKSPLFSSYQRRFTRWNNQLGLKLVLLNKQISYKTGNTCQITFRPREKGREGAKQDQAKRKHSEYQNMMSKYLSFHRRLQTGDDYIIFMRVKNRIHRKQNDEESEVADNRRWHEARKKRKGRF